jgi:hypothetical protein
MAMICAMFCAMGLSLGTKPDRASPKGIIQIAAAVSVLSSRTGGTAFSLTDDFLAMS